MVATADRNITTQQEQALVLWFLDVDMGDVSLVGGKNARLRKMIQQLTFKDINNLSGAS